MSSALAQSIASAIQTQEGYGTPNAVTINANFNPGALIAAPGYPVVNGFAQFPDYSTGFAAAASLVQSYIDKGYTLSQLTAKWAPAGVSNDPTGLNNPTTYAQNVAAATGLPTDVPLNNLAGGSDGSTPADIADYGDTVPAEASAIDFSNPAVIGGLAIGGLVVWSLFRSAFDR